MSNNLQDGNITIFEALNNIKNGKYVMPAFQRQYVWSMEQIEKLWDSILLNYPIATFLFWRVDDTNVTKDTYFCNFLPEVTFDSRKQAVSANYRLSSIDTQTTDTAILDGQQRLTSLYLSLFGDAYIKQKYARKSSVGGTFIKLVIELNKNKLMVDEEEYNSKKYDIRFTDKIGKISPTQFDVKNILKEEFRNPDTREVAINNAIARVPSESKSYAKNILLNLYNKIFVDKLIRYTEIQEMNQDDALEMFVRFNSGGKALKKHEITMSILEAYWPSSKSSFGKLLVGSYEGFGTDFIIRTALMLYGDVVKSNINKKIADDLKNNWDDFKKALENLEALLKEFNIKVNRFASSWNVLIPIIYCIYNNPNYNEKEQKMGIFSYLARAVLFTYFQSGTTSKLQQMKSNIIDYNFEITTEMLDQMNELRITDGKIEDIINAEKGSRVAGEALYFLGLDWINNDYKYEQDHLHPYSCFEGSKPSCRITPENWKKWHSTRNRLPNLQLLEGRSNGSKNGMGLLDYYNEMNDSQKEAFRKQAMIPDDISLELEDFEKFYEKRSILLTQKLKSILS